MEILNHLNKAKKTVHFMVFLEKLVAQFKPLQVYQYAQLGQQRQTESVFCNSQQKEEAIYYLLIITEGSTRIENGIQDFANQHYEEGKVVVHAHGATALKQNIAQSNYYFATVLNQGQLLYSANGVLCLEEVTTPRPEKRLAQAKLHWKHRGKMAQGFLAAAERALEEDHETVCLFLLHQVIEQACIGLIWVFMGYKSDMHNLRRLLYVCACFSKKPMQHFMGMPENELMLSIIMRSYSEARYRESFSLENRSAYNFLELVERFMELAEELCKEKFEAMEAGLPVELEKVEEEVVND
ncbi:HEPN domain-containing protein [Pedobacter ureilyticus]|uniref:HEPN domain-containing protein n=1 Tax=Pedobacter ureilyticus TaxID=1393051 RepID=A0ABW9JAN9_9SPHI|nr:HEPN domain-containing protein [Pedobacter helvus]